MNKQFSFVVMADVLGFRKLTERKGALELATEYKDFLDSYVKRVCELTIKESDIERMTSQVPVLNKNKAIAEALKKALPQADFTLHHQVFSDTILLWWNVDPIVDAKAEEQKIDNFVYKFLMSLPMLILNGLTEGFPLRVGVAYGECVIEPEERIYVGHPIVNAHRTEIAQEWMGIAFHPSCFDFFKNEIALSRVFVAGNPYIRKCIVPTKDSSDDQEKLELEWSANWPLLPLAYSQIDSDTEFLDLEAICKKKKEEAPENAKAKWENTLKFVNDCNHNGSVDAIVAFMSGRLPIPDTAFDNPDPNGAID